jgi:RNA polymerase sigma factor (sigma-70 family)
MQESTIMVSEQDLTQLLVQAKAGDTTSLGHLCEEAKVRLQLVVKYRLRGWSEADREDLVQDVLITFCEKIQMVERTPMAFALWILRQKIGSELQKAHRSRTRSFTEAFGKDGQDTDSTVAEPPDPDADPALEYERKENAERIREAINMLSEFCRTVFAGLLEGMRIQEIWVRYQEIEPDLQRSAFDKRTHGCRRKLFALLGESDEE